MKNDLFKSRSINGDEFAVELGYANLQELCQNFERMKRMNTTELRNSDLTDLTDINIDDSLGTSEWFQAFLRQVKNPYFFKYNGEIVSLSEYERRLLDHFLQSLFKESGQEIR